MTSRTNTLRTIKLAFATAAVLALMSQAAQAKPIGPIGAQVQPTQSSTPYQGTYRPATDVVTTPPDRTDLIGTTRAVLGQHTVTKTAVAHTTTNSFDWTAATVGAGSTLIVVLIAGAGLAARGRRRVPLSA
jgi:hypothetical protein